MRSVRRGQAYPGLLLLALGPLDHVFNGVRDCLIVRPALQGGVVIYHAGPLSRNWAGLGLAVVEHQMANMTEIRFLVLVTIVPLEHERCVGCSGRL